ncbi:MULTISPECIES: adenosine deaminase [unclassified Frigoribacterium]|uniref:adenosine deaminase n=1 Tax=unclassified Frigoribacterium TaxID=2627005 RepID=UPI0015646F3A|nr:MULTISPECIES: adenosine deaminase [unclassified Frigoribacterium]NQW86532.1 adenosine deaminase [Frigoribacterium sp. VKM Ac-2860]NQX07863.1 adenosine deaminase [Frigoribacterium sp. VKM Ac-2859]
MSAPDKDYRLPNGGPRLAALPKVSLHDHLDGGLRPETIVDLAVEAGVDLPASEPEALRRWFVENADSGTLVDYLATFELTVAVMQTREQLTRVAHEFVLDLAADGVVHAEVRWAPEQHQRQGLTLDQAVEAVQAGFASAVRSLADDGYEISVGQILSALRQGERSLEIAQLAVRHRENGVLAFDIAGPEAGYPAADHRVAFDLLAREFMPVTVHAGEADGLDSIRGALIDGRALRLGHGVRIAEDIRVVASKGSTSTVEIGPIASWVRDREIPLELSPQSNLQTGAIAAWGTDLDDHPFDLLYQLGYGVTVNTDNRLMSDTSLCKELALLSQAFDYDLDDNETFQLNAAASCFLPLEDREALADRITAGFEGA